MSAQSRFTLLINSCDGYADCWPPFFTLLHRYWPTIAAPILLNTGSKNWTSAQLLVKCTQVEKTSHKRLTWSQCLLQALDQVETDLLLYMQEDYFIEQPVDDDLVQAMAEKMLRRSEIKHVGLTHFGSMPPFSKTDDPRLWEISRQSKYRVSTQAGLWRTKTLRSLIRPSEDGMNFEGLGTRRASRRQDLFLTVSRDAAAPPICYQHTGIVRGEWSRFMVPLSEKENLGIDFSKRGFYDPMRPPNTERRLEKLRKKLGKFVPTLIGGSSNR